MRTILELGGSDIYNFFKEDLETPLISDGEIEIHVNGQVVWASDGIDEAMERQRARGRVQLVLEDIVGLKGYESEEPKNPCKVQPKAEYLSPSDPDPMEYLNHPG